MPARRAQCSSTRYSGIVGLAWLGIGAYPFAILAMMAMLLFSQRKAFAAGKATELTVCCCGTGALASAALPGKALGAYLVGFVVQILAVWGYADVVLWTDQEEAITAVVNEVAKRRNHRTLHRRIARYSHASLGRAEQGNWAVEAHTRTLMEALADAIGRPIQTSEPIFAWLARHAGWLLTRFRVRPDGRTS